MMVMMMMMMMKSVLKSPATKLMQTVAMLLLMHNMCVLAIVLRQLSHGCVMDDKSYACSVKSDSRITNISQLFPKPGDPDVDKEVLVALSELTYLHMSCIDAPITKDQSLSKELFTRMPKLQKILILGCSIASISMNAIAELKHLKTLDLSNNRLRTLPSQLFWGLKLDTLRLNQNKNIKLSDSLRALDVNVLSLKQCNLTQIPVESLQAARRLRTLFISNNSIKEIPILLKPLFDGLSSIHIEGNPIRCDCRVRWLQAYNWTIPTRVNLKYVGVECASPQRLFGQRLTQVKRNELTCEKPIISNLHLNVQPTGAQLTCSTTGSDPMVTWTLRDTSSSATGTRQAEVGRRFSARLPRLHQSDTAQYELSAANFDNETTNVSVSITWMMKAAARTIDAATTLATQQVQQQQQQQQQLTLPQRPTSPPEPPLVVGESGDDENYFSRKQFTLIEMVVAVIATFIVTSFVFLLFWLAARQLDHRHKKRDTKEAYPYHTHSYHSNVGTGNASSVHEYESVPGNEQPLISRQLRGTASHSAATPAAAAVPLPVNIAATTTRINIPTPHPPHFPPPSPASAASGREYVSFDDPSVRC